jgi:hypothetical protein
MRLNKRQLLQIIFEQQVQDSKTPSEVKPEEDVWGTGEDLENPIDWEEESGMPSNVEEPEILKIVEKLKRRMRIKKVIREQMAAVAADEIDPETGEVLDVIDDVVEPDAQEERASASQQSLRNWLKDTAAGIAGMSIADSQVPSLIAAMDDLLMSAQSGKMASREDKVRSHIDTE